MMLLMESIAEELSSFSTKFKICTHTPDPTANSQIVIIRGGGRYVKGLNGSVVYTVVQIQVYHKDKRTAEITMNKVIEKLDSNTNISGVEIAHWAGAVHYWTADNGLHCFVTEFVLIHV